MNLKSKFLTYFFIIAMLSSCSAGSDREKWIAQAKKNIREGRDLGDFSGLTKGTYETIFGLSYGEYYEIIFYENKTSKVELNNAPDKICSEYGRKPANIETGQVTNRAIDFFYYTENYEHIKNQSQIPSHWRSLNFNCE